MKKNAILIGIKPKMRSFFINLKANFIFFVCVCVALLFLGGYPSAYADTYFIYFDNFDTETPGDPPNLIPPGLPGDFGWVPGDYNILYDDGLPEIFVQSVGGFSPNSLRILRTETTGIAPTFEGRVDPNCDYTKLEQRVYWNMLSEQKPAAPTGTFQITLGNEGAVCTVFYQGNTIWYQDGTGLNDTLIPFDADVFNGFQVLIDFPNKTFNLYIDTTYCGVVPPPCAVHVGVDRPFQYWDPGITTQIQGFSFANYDTTASDGYAIDDIRFYAVDLPDTDEDSIADCMDNCPDDLNSGQADVDVDGVGDACDNCPDDFNDAQADNDNDGIGNVCDICPTIWDVDQVDTDGDTVGDLCDNCPNEPNSDQTDSDGDAIPGVGGGDACETPGDIDEILFSAEPKNKQDEAEENFSDDTDSDGIFDDGDGSGVVGDNTCQGGSTESCDDNCLKLANGPSAFIPEAGNQLDTDSDGVGNACDNCELVSNPDQVDLDGDGYGDDCDNCKTKFNPDQADFDGDDIGDLCDDDKDDDTYTFASGDCNDFDASINPGSADLLKDCIPDNDPGLVIIMTGGDYSTYLPEIGASVELTLRYNDANGDEQTLPSSWADFVWSFDDVSSYLGRFGNDDPIDLGPDFVLTPTGDSKKVLLESNDSGGRAVVRLAVSDASGALQASATKTFPLDWDGDLLPYAWEVLYGDIPGAGADQEVLGIVNPNAVGTFSIGDKFPAHYEYRGVDVNADGSISPDERFSPIMKDLILTLKGYESTPIGPIDFKPFFDAPNCFREAGIDVHLVNKPDFKENGVEVLEVEHHPDETLIGTDGNKNHDGIDFWTYDPRGRSGVGDINDYGDKRGIEYTRTFDFPWWNFHTQSPYINYTIAEGGVSDGFDPYPQREDANDDCVIGGREDDKSPRGPNTDVCVKDSNIPGGYDWEAGINPNTADDADHPLNIILGGVESDPIHTLWSVLIHEATHSLGVGPHCDDDTCIMHKVKINHAINHICDYCRAKIQIHKE